MPSIDLRLKTPIERTARVAQIEGMFDVPKAAESEVRIKAEVDLDKQPWQIGLITGPSGSGKSTIARHLFGNKLIEGYRWHRTKAVADNFGKLGAQDVTAALSSVGFSSPPAWLRPFHVLSNGEKFRCNLARALVDPRPLVAIDEFTSVVDRTVARIGSAAVAKHVRRTEGKQLVAVSCHDDLIDWLQPDWILEPHVGLVTWRSVQPRPRIEMEIIRCRHEAWSWFAPHHYLTRSLATSAKCFMGLVEGRPAAFAGLINFPHPHVHKTFRISRLVTLPDFQGISLGIRLGYACAAIAATNGYSLIAQAGHPAVLAGAPRHGDCSITGKRVVEKYGARKREGGIRDGDHYRRWGKAMFSPQIRGTASIKYTGQPVPPHQVAQARLLWHVRA